MTPTTNHKRLDAEGQAVIEEVLQERLRLAIKYTLVHVLEEEVDAFVKAAPYQRSPDRRDQRNGDYARDLGTSMVRRHETTLGVIEDLPAPRTRQGFRTELFERYQRRQVELDEAILEMFVGGVSTARVGEVVSKVLQDNELVTVV
ncbi:MAG TPA: transposase [Anaerolineales bacterium]|nr:transposase [Anaerolineales bacterium]